MQGLNTTHVQGAHHMQAALERPAGQALITVCNHVASMDDPLVMSTILPTEAFRDASLLR
jgi:monolysocardiolipin acyltransferase